MASHALIAPQMTARLAADVSTRARAWMLDAVIDINLNPRLVDANSYITKFSHEYVRDIFHRCDPFIAKHMKGLDLISFSMLKDRSSLHLIDAVPVVGILHGTHEISLRTVQRMFGQIDGFAAAWTPLYFGPGKPCKDFNDHPMFKTLLESSSPIHTAPNQIIRVDFRGNSADRQTAIGKMRDRCRVWKFDGEISCACHPCLITDQVIVHSYLRQIIIISGNSDSEHWAEAWQFISYTMPKDRSSLQNRDSVPVTGIFGHVSQSVKLQSFQRILDGIPGVKATWTPVHLGQGVSLASSAVYRAFLDTSTKDLADQNTCSMIRVDVIGSSDDALQARKRGPKGPRNQFVTEMDS